ncbi:hypothetical protein [Bradyrhizobium sp. USDA 4454]
MNFITTTAIATAVPTAAAPAMMLDDRHPTPDPIIALVSELIETERLLVSIEERRTKAERILNRWERRNRKPAMRDAIVLGSNAEYAHWFNQWVEADSDEAKERLRLSDPNRDRKLAMSELEQARSIWKCRRENAARQLELDDILDTQLKTHNRVEEIVAELADFRPVSFEGLAAKARVARELIPRKENWSDDLKFALTFDIGAMAGELEECSSLAA